mgnify:CR=1 FL=1
MLQFIANTKGYAQADLQTNKVTFFGGYESPVTNEEPRRARLLDLLQLLDKLLRLVTTRRTAPQCHEAILSPLASA